MSIFQNLPVKIVVLFIAIGLWAYVAYGQSKVGEFPGDLQLQVRNLNPDLVAIYDIKTVKIKVLAEPSIWKKLSAESFNAYLDLNSLSMGVYEKEVIVEPRIGSVQIVEKTPAQVRVRLETRLSKTVPVLPKVEGQAGEDLAPGDPRVTPLQVDVTGAKSVIDAISEAIASVKISGETQEITRLVRLVALDAEGKEIKDVRFEPEEVKVTIPIVAAAKTKSVGIKVKLDGRPKSGYWISGLNLTPLSVAIAGSRENLKSINFIETNTVSVDGLDQNKTITVTLNLPSGITLVSEANSVKVEIQISGTEMQKEVIAGINYDGLAANLVVGEINPKEIKVMISGRSDQLDQANSSNVVINLNISPYRSAGVYSVDLLKSWISLPSNLTVVSFIPSAVSIRLDNK
jgi:YbbR domain-containing protein